MKATTSGVGTGEVALSFIDRAIGLVSPARMTARIQNKFAVRYLNSMLERGAFKASEISRHNANWISNESDINLVLANELPRIRARSRWLVRNNPYAKSAVNTFLNYCVGVGFDLQMGVYRPVKNADGEFDIEELDAFNDYTEDVFGDWARDVHISASESAPDNFHEIQTMAFQRVIEDGEAFIHLVPHRTKILQTEFVEPESLDTFKTSADNGNPVILGVEVDKKSWKPVAYWVRSANPENKGNVFSMESRRVPAAEMIHAFIRQYPRQIRGLPWFHAVSEDIFQLGEYKNAVALRNKIAALFAVLFKGGRKTVMGLDGGNDTGTPNASPGFPTDASGNPLVNLAPGMMGTLPEGVEPVTINPTAPENTYDMFTKSLLIAIGAGIQGGMSYQGLTRDTSQTTFASGRAAGQMDMQAYRPIQRFIGAKICSPIFRKWFELAVMSGALLDESGVRADYLVRPEFWTRHAWLPGGWSWGINPTQEVKAAKDSMDARITTLADECSALGLDWKVQIRKTRKIQQFAAKQGVSLNQPAVPVAGIPDTQDGPAMEAAMDAAAK